MFFADQKSQFGYVLEGLGTENVDTFYGHLKYKTNLVHFMVMWYISARFGMLYQEKFGNPASKC
jgi:hypothetical protein